MARISPQEAAAKYARRAAQATGDYTAGIQRVTIAPGQQAAAKAQKALAGYTDALQSGRWANRVKAVSLQDWQSRASSVGASRFAQGAQAAEQKVADRMAQILPAVDAARAKVMSMPDDSVQARIQRSVAFQTEMAKFKVR